MSVRALKKKDNLNNQKQKIILKVEESRNELKNRRTISNPNLSNLEINQSQLKMFKSESDISTNLEDKKKQQVTGKIQDKLINSKSEVCLKTIAVHNTRNDKLHPYERRRMSSNDLVNSRSSLTSSSPGASGIRVRIPIIGYEVMEERARFTVYKLRIENPVTNNCWLVLRRYTDFVRLNNKLKQTFPKFNLTLPRKKLFGDNFSSVFLENRVQGLQMYINGIMANETLRNYQNIRDFFCLDEAPSYSDSMVENRELYEAQEETISHLKLQLRERDETIFELRTQLLEEMKISVR